MEVGDYLSASQKKRAQRRKYIVIALSVIAACLVVVGSFWIVFKSPIFKIKNIVVQGNASVASDDIIALVRLVALKNQNVVTSLLQIGNILAWPNSISSSNRASLPELANITMAKNYITRTIAITVTERKPFAVWCFMPHGGIVDMSVSGAATDSTLQQNSQPPQSFGGQAGQASTSTTSLSVVNSSGTNYSVPNGSLQATAVAVFAEADEQCYWFDGNGIMFEKGFDSEGSILLALHDYSQSPASLGAAILPTRFIPNLVSIVNVLRTSGLNVKEVRLNDIGLQEIQAKTFDGPDILFSLRFSANEDLPVIESIMAKSGFKNLQYLDFRTEDRAYYK